MTCDQRARAVRLIPHGHAMVEATRKRARIESDVLSRVGERRLASTKKVLAALADSLGLRERMDARVVPLEK